MSIALAPNITNEHLPKNFSDWTFDHKINLFSSQVLGWQLNIAHEIINDPDNKHPHAGFAVLSILFNYFEMIGGYLAGIEGETNRTHFNIGITNVFPGLDLRPDIVKLLFKEARCGLYHVGITGKDIVLSRNYPGVVTVFKKPGGSVVIIDPHRLATTLIEHFKTYIDHIKGNTLGIERVNFEKRFNFLKQENFE